MPQTTELTKIRTIEQGLQELAAALQLGARPDGSAYRFISNEHPRYEELIEVCRELHSDEMPNDWRFGITYDICHALLEYSEPDEDTWDADMYKELAGQVSSDLTEVLYCDLFQWLADRNGRYCWIDEEATLAGHSGYSLGELAQKRQEEEIKWMIEELVDQMEALTE